MPRSPTFESRTPSSLPVDEPATTTSTPGTLRQPQRLQHLLRSQDFSSPVKNAVPVSFRTEDTLRLRSYLPPRLYSTTSQNGHFHREQEAWLRSHQGRVRLRARSLLRYGERALADLEPSACPPSRLPGTSSLVPKLPPELSPPQPPAQRTTTLLKARESRSRGLRRRTERT